HLAPWWDPATGPPAHCANAWVWLGAAGGVTSRVSLGPAVSAIMHRYNPVVMAQQAATLELLNPGRAFLGVGSGEAMNEVPAGLDWPLPAEQLARTDEAALESSREWKGTLADENYAGDTSDPAQVGAVGEENVSDRKYRMMAMLSADPAKHVRQIKAMRSMGATAVVVMNISGADPL